MSDFFLYTKLFPITYILFCLSCAAFAFISWKNPKWGVYLICAFLPAYLIRFKGPFDLPMTALELMILVLFAVWTVKNLRFTIYDLRFQLPIIRAIARIIGMNKILIVGGFLFLTAATISMFLSPDLRAAAGIWKAYFIEPLLFLAVFVSVIKKDDIKNVVRAFGFSAFYISLYAFAQKFFGAPIPIPWQAEMRATSIFDFPNAVGLFLAPLIPLFAAQIIFNFKFSILNQIRIFDYQFSKFLISGIWFIIIILSLLSIYFAKSEGALVALAAGFFIWLFIKLKTHGKIILSIIGAATIASILFINAAPFPQIKEKLLLNDWSGMVRKTVWSETIEMLKDNPISGAGLSGYQTAIVLYHNAKWMEIFLYPHNIVLNFWSEIGILGLLGFIIIIIGFYKQIGNLKSEIGNFLMISMAVLLIHGLVDVPYFKNDLSVLFWILIGLATISDSTKTVDL